MCGLYLDGLVDQRCLELNHCQEIMIRLGRNDANRTQKEACLFDVEPTILIANLHDDARIQLSWKLSD
jgi:hypothetical protein